MTDYREITDRVKCPTCLGAGRVPPAGHCETCRGSGVASEYRNFLDLLLAVERLGGFNRTERLPEAGRFWRRDLWLPANVDPYSVSPAALTHAVVADLDDWPKVQVEVEAANPPFPVRLCVSGGNLAGLRVSGYTLRGLIRPVDERPWLQAMLDSRLEGPETRLKI